jgi:hypothetical protein
VGWGNAPITSLTVPSDALDSEPHVTITDESDMPAELIAKYGAGVIVAAQIWYLESAVYLYRALLNTGDQYTRDGLGFGGFAYEFAAYSVAFSKPTVQYGVEDDTVVTFGSTAGGTPPTTNVNFTVNSETAFQGAATLSGTLAVTATGVVELDDTAEMIYDGDRNLIPHWGRVGPTAPDVNGYVTVTHGLPWTPTHVFIQTEAPISGADIFIAGTVDQLTSTTFRVRCFNFTTIVAANVTFSWIAFQTIV